MTRGATLAVVVALIIATSPSAALGYLTVGHAHHYAQRVAATALTKEASEYGVVQESLVRHCWQITSRHVGCRIQLDLTMFTGDQARCLTVATITYKHGRSGPLRWSDDDDTCWSRD